MNSKNSRQASASRHTLTVNSFFAGIGGFDLGFEGAGFKVRLQCEINEFCLDILKLHWPKAVQTTDILSLEPNMIPRASVWTGGFPCQDVSVARGSLGRHGLDGSRSGLFHRFAELISKGKPRVVVIENVTGLLNSNQGRDFLVILRKFDSLGYAVAWRVVNSRYFGVPQSRPRVYIVAWKNGVSEAAHALFEPSGSPKPTDERKGFLEIAPNLPDNIFIPRVGFCLAATSGRHTGTDWSRTYVAYANKARRLTPEECEGLQGFPKKWTLPEAACQLDDNETDSARYHALGNAVSVPTVEWIAKRIRQALEGKGARLKWRRSELTLDKALNSERRAFDLLASAEPAFASARAFSLKLSAPKLKSDHGHYWPNAGIAWRGNCIGGAVSHAPSKIPLTSLGDIVEVGPIDDRYYLSKNAAEGILRRVDNQGRTLFAPLYAALEKVANRHSKNSAKPDVSSANQTLLPTLIAAAQ